MSQTLNGRLPLEDSSDWPQTWPKRVSDVHKKIWMKFSEQKVTMQMKGQIKNELFWSSYEFLSVIGSSVSKMTPDELNFSPLQLLAEG